MEETVKSFGCIDGLYNNAGIEGRQATLTEYDVNIFQKVVDINLMGVYYSMRYVLPVMQQQKYGCIVNVASAGGIRGVKNQTPFGSSKHAVSGLTKMPHSNTAGMGSPPMLLLRALFSSL